MTVDLETGMRRLKVWAIRIAMNEEFGQATVDEDKLAEVVDGLTLDQIFERISREERLKQDGWSARLGRMLGGVWRWRR